MSNAKDTVRISFELPRHEYDRLGQELRVLAKGGSAPETVERLVYELVRDRLEYGDRSYDLREGPKSDQKVYHLRAETWARALRLARQRLYERHRHDKKAGTAEAWLRPCGDMCFVEVEYGG